MADQSDIYLGLTIEQLRVKAGLVSTDVSHDTQIGVAFSVALDAVEQYLDRMLRLADYSEVFTHFTGSTVSLKAYPIKSVDVLITASGSEPRFHPENNTGLIHLDGYVRSHELMVTYSGGYKMLPPLFMFALLSVFESAWTAISDGALVGGGRVSRISVPDVGAISYAEASGGSSFDDVGFIPGAIVSILQPYRRQAC